MDLTSDLIKLSEKGFLERDTMAKKKSDADIADVIEEIASYAIPPLGALKVGLKAYGYLNKKGIIPNPDCPKCGTRLEVEQRSERKARYVCPNSECKHRSKKGWDPRLF